MPHGPERVYHAGGAAASCDGQHLTHHPWNAEAALPRWRSVVPSVPANYWRAAALMEPSEVPVPAAEPSSARARHVTSSEGGESPGYL